jgi:dipeptidyl aminopeptidase/acylaminoacyl peptidase
VADLPFSRVIPASADSAPASLLFGFSTRVGSELTSAGIFQSNLNGRDFLALAESGLTLLDHSDAGLLAAQGQNLYLITDAARTLLANQLASDALFLADGRVAAILQSKNGNQLALFTEGASQIIPTESAPQTLHPSRDPNHLYWSADGQTFATALSDLTSTALPYAGSPAFAADGKMAFLNRDAKGENELTLVNGDASQTLPLFGNRLVDMSWSPDGSTLAVSVANVSDYSGLTLASKLYFVQWPASLDKVLEMTDEAAIERLVWSPDGKSLLLVTRNAADGRIRFSVLDAVAQTQIPALGFDWVSEEYLLLLPVFWLP